MKYYFSLQLKRSARKLKEIGINPFLALIIAVLGMGIFTEVLFYKTLYAVYIYIGFFIFMLLTLSNKNRVGLIQRIFSGSDFNRIRIIENIILFIPFGIIFLINSEFLAFLICFSLSIISVYIKTQSPFSKVIPTPFKKYPHESIVGFRTTFILSGLLYLISIKAIQVQNYNLGIAVIFFLYIIQLTSYFKPESRYFVWIEELNAERFIFRKLKFGFISASIITAPIIVIMFWFFPDKLTYTVGAYFLGLIYLAMIILAKYAAYPNEMNLPQAIIIAICFSLPPTLLVVIPYFYSKALKNLRPILT